MAQRISPNPVFQLLDENGIDTILSINNDGSAVNGQSVAPVNSPSGTGLIPQVDRILLSSAQLLALKTTPMQLIPAPAAGYVTIIEAINLRYLFGGTAYTLNAGTLKLFYGPVANAKALTADQAALLTGGANGTVLGILATAVGTAAAPLTDAQALAQAIFLGNDGTANYTLGNGTLEVEVFYMTTQI